MEINNKTILITGASGLVGVPAVRKCLEQGAKKVYAVDVRENAELTALETQYPDRCEIIYTNFLIEIVCINA